MLLYSLVEVQPVWFNVVFSWRVVDNLYFWYCIECFFVIHSGNDSLVEVAYLDADIPQRVNPIRIESCESFRMRAEAFISECLAITNDSNGSGIIKCV